MLDTNNNLHIDGIEIMARLDSLATFSESNAELTRTFLTPAHKAAAQQIKQWMIEAGMHVVVDAAANVIGRYEATLPAQPALLLGSHYDTVRNAGRYDGALGIVTSIACIDALNRAGKRFPFAIEVIAFSEEEGVRYNATLLGSRALAGNFDKSLLDTVDANGVSMRAAFTNYGLDADSIDSARYPAKSLLAFVEIHIEQGPVLLEQNLPVGIVSAIAGASRYQIRINGQTGHAGTVPMHLRRDAITTAAEIVLLVEQICQSDVDIVGTVGQFHPSNGSANVISGQVDISIDVRSTIDSKRQRACAAILEGIDEIASRRNAQTDVRKTHEAAAVHCDDQLIDKLKFAVEQSNIPALVIPSGAGHDAMALADLTRVAMLFVRCGNGGISHDPSETISDADAIVASQTLLNFIDCFQS